MLIYIDSSIFTGPTSDENTEPNIINANRNETNSKRTDFWGGTGGDFEKKTGDTLRGRVRGPKEVRTPSIRLGASGKHGKFLQPGPRPKTATFEPSDLAFDGWPLVQEPVILDLFRDYPCEPVLDR